MAQYRAKLFNETSRQIHFVYKTTVPGGCTRGIQPGPPDDAGRNFTTDYLQYAHQHAMFYGRDLYVLAKLKKLNWPSMDMRMLYSRTDSHPGVSRNVGNTRKRDCLHMCSPGPIDIAADLFQELLSHELRLET